MCKQGAYDVTQKLPLYAVTKSQLQQRLRHRLQRSDCCTNTYLESHCNKQQNMNVHISSLSESGNLLTGRFTYQCDGHTNFAGKNCSGDLVWKVQMWNNFDLKIADPSQITAE